MYMTVAADTCVPVTRDVVGTINNSKRQVKEIKIYEPSKEVALSWKYMSPISRGYF